MKIIKVIIIFFWVSVFLVSLFLRILTDLDFSSLIYWWLIFGWVVVVWSFHLEDAFSLKISFVLFILGGLTTVVGFENIGEVGMKIGFIGWLIGIIQALIEYRRSDVKNQQKTD